MITLNTNVLNAPATSTEKNLSTKGYKANLAAACALPEVVDEPTAWKAFQVVSKGTNYTYVTFQKYFAPYAASLAATKVVPPVKK
jgi:hypothetical protein